MWRAAGHYIGKPLVDATGQRACTWARACFTLTTAVSAKAAWLFPWRHELQPREGNWTTSAGAALLGRQGEKVEVRTRTQRSRKGSAGWLRPACKITLGRTEAALLLINSAQHLLGSSEAWTREWMDGVLDSRDLSHCRDETWRRKLKDWFKGCRKPWLQDYLPGPQSINVF